MNGLIYLAVIAYSILIYVLFDSWTQKGETDNYYPFADSIAKGNWDIRPPRGWLEIVPLAYLFRWCGIGNEYKHDLEIIHLWMYVSNMISQILALLIINQYKPLSWWFVALFLVFTTVPSAKWWGGWRYVFGHGAVLAAITGHYWLCGILSAIAFFHSFEMGFVPLFSTLFAGHGLQQIGAFLGTLVVPWGHLRHYIHNIFDKRGPQFYLDPDYKIDAHLIFRIAFIFLFFPFVHTAPVVVFVYGILMYIGTFRNVGGAEIFPALQILLALAYLQ